MATSPRAKQCKGAGADLDRGEAERLVREAIQYAMATKRDSVTLVHNGNIMKFTEGAFKDWGYQIAREEFGDGPSPSRS